MKKNDYKVEDLKYGQQTTKALNISIEEGERVFEEFRKSGGDDIDAVAWYDKTSSTHPVGKKAPNGLGIHDMSGNV